MSALQPDAIPAQTQDHQPGREAAMVPRPDYAPRYPGSSRLKGKVAIVTGGDSGIGRAVSVLFAREGARIGIVYLEEDEDAHITADLITAEGGESILIKADVGQKKSCEEAVAKTIRAYGRLDILINNAAEQHVQDELTDISETQLEDTFRTNIFGYVFMAQAALPHLEAGASIINTTSITAYRGSPTLVDYAATKGAILGFTRALSAQLADKGIRVNGVAPGPIWTPLIPASFPADKVAEFGQSQPLGRVGQPNEVAPSYLFLACEDASYMSGQVLHPNGGEIIGG